MEKKENVATNAKKVNVYEQIDDFKNVTGFSTCMTDEDGCFLDVITCGGFDKYYLGDNEIDSIKEVEVGRSVYSTVPSVDFTFKKDELTEAGITQEMLVEDNNEKVIAFIKESVGTIDSEYELLCKCNGNYDEVLYSGIMDDEPGVEYFVNFDDDDDELVLCVTIPVKITVVDDGVLNIEYIW